MHTVTHILVLNNPQYHRMCRLELICPASGVGVDVDPPHHRPIREGGRNVRHQRISPRFRPCNRASLAGHERRRDRRNRTGNWRISREDEKWRAGIEENRSE